MSVTQPLPSNTDVSNLAAAIVKWQETWTRLWHESEDKVMPPTPFFRTIQFEHRRNFDLWHEEDKARSPGATPEQIGSYKRRIDKLNQERNDLIEQLDEGYLTMLVQRKVQAPPDAPWNTETPGSATDRLSIIALKIFHMREQEERTDATESHREKCHAKRLTLERQRADLAAALQILIDELFEGKKQMKLYRQFKMYNDPSLNPEIYKHGPNKTS